MPLGLFQVTDTSRPLRFPTSCGRPGFSRLYCTLRLSLQPPVCTLPAWSLSRLPQGSPVCPSAPGKFLGVQKALVGGRGYRRVPS